MAHALAVGDTVICQLFNTAERRFYGDVFYGTIVSIDEDERAKERFWGHRPNRKPFLVRRKDNQPSLWLHRKEILRRVLPENRP